MNLTKITKISILNGLILLFLTLAEFLELVKFDLILSYQWHKILHILGIILFMGNMIVGPFWFLFAYYSKDKILLNISSSLSSFFSVGVGLILSVIFKGNESVRFNFLRPDWLKHFFPVNIHICYFSAFINKRIYSHPPNRSKCLIYDTFFPLIFSDTHEWEIH